MFKRTLVLATAFIVLVASVIINLAILDIIPMEELRGSLRKLIAVGAVSTVALVLIYKLFRVAAPKAPEKEGSPARMPDPPAEEEKNGRKGD